MEHTTEEIIAARLEADRTIAGFPTTFGPADYQLAGEDQVNYRTLVTIVDWARMTLLGAHLVPHVPALDVEGRVRTDVGVGSAPVALGRYDLQLIRDAIDTYLARKP